LFKKVAEKNRNCVRCQKPLGFRKHEPENSNWGFEDGKLCNSCFDYVKDGIKRFDANYIEGYSRFPFRMEGKLYIQTFDESNRVIFEPKKKSQYEIDIPPERLVDCNIVTKEENSLARRMLTANTVKSKEKRLIQIDFLDASNNNKLETALFELKDSDDTNNAHNLIFLIKGKTKSAPQRQERTNLDTQNSDTGLVLETESTSDVEQVMEQKTYCNKCGNECDIENKFCSNCGTILADIVTEDQVEDDSEVKRIRESYDPEKEKAFFRDDGEIIVKRTEHRGKGRKIGSWLVAGPIGYVAIGRDKTRKTKARGTLVVTNKALYCAGNVYPYDKVISITRSRKSILLILVKEFEEQRFTSKLELKTDDKDGLFRALEAARMSQIQF
jgi:ribosomal protein S27AE